MMALMMSSSIRCVGCVYPSRRVIGAGWYACSNSHSNHKTLCRIYEWKNWPALSEGLPA